MSEGHGLEFGSRHDDYDDEYEDNEVLADGNDDRRQDDYRNEEAVDRLTDEAVDDAHPLTGAMS